MKNKNRMNRKLLKASLLGAFCFSVAVLALLGLGSLALDKIYFDPETPADGIELESLLTQAGGQFYLDMAIYDEVHFPETAVGGSAVSPKGFGRYELSVPRHALLGREGDFDLQTLHLVRGKICAERFDFFAYPNITLFSSKHKLDNHQENVPNLKLESDVEENEKTLDEIQKLPESAVVAAYISFRENVNSLYFYDLQAQIPELSVHWVAVDVGERNALLDVGFNLRPGLQTIPGTAAEEKYPSLNPVYQDRDDFGETMDTHFKSLLRYLSDREAFLNALLGDPGSPDVKQHSDLYRNALTYVETNGVRIPTALVTGTPDTILTFARQENVYTVNVSDVKVSAFSK